MAEASSSSEPVDHSTEAIAALWGESNELRDKYIELIEQSPGNYNSHALFVLATVLLCAKQRPFEQAAYYMYLGQLRGFYDVYRSKDQTTSGDLYTLFAEICGPVLFQLHQKEVSISMLETLFKKVFEMDEIIPHNYDPCWMNAFGLSAMHAAIGGKTFNKQDMCIPVEQWENMAKKAREFFRGISNQIIKGVRERKEAAANDA